MARSTLLSRGTAKGRRDAWSPFDSVTVGDAIPTLSKVVRREDVKAYADASGDQNPLHQDDGFARWWGSRASSPTGCSPWRTS